MSLSLAWGIDDTVTVNGTIYKLDLEFSSVLRFYDMWKDDELAEEYKIFLSLVMGLGLDLKKIQSFDDLEVYVHPEDVEGLLQAIIKRIAGDTPQNETVKRDKNGNILEDEETKYYDIEEDSGYIYASFLMDYHIDLIEEREKRTLHWDKFNYLLSSLSENTKFKKIIEIRAMPIPKDATYERKEEIRKAKLAVALKTTRSEIEFDMMDLKQKREYMEKKQREQGSE